MKKPSSFAWLLALATLSPFCVYYAQGARTYALTLVLLACAWGPGDWFLQIHDQVADGRR